MGCEGSARLVVALGVVSIGLLWAGVQKTCTALSNRTPTVMSYSDYVRTKPSASWLTLTNCRLDLPNACLSHESGDINNERDKYYIPVLDPNAPKEQAAVLYETTDASICAPLKELKGLGSEEAVKKWVIANYDRVFPKRNISGLVSFGIESTDNRSELEGLEKNMQDNFIILNANGQPSLAAGIGFTGAGLAIFSGLVLSFRRKSS